jgi:hypothetical protein
MRSALSRRLLLFIAVLPMIGACSLNRYVKEAEIQRLTVQRDALRNLQIQLQDPANAQDQQDLELLVGADVLNATLAIADKLSMPVPNYRDGEVVVNTIRYGGQDGSGLLSIDATAKDHRRNVQLNVLVVARLLVTSEGNLLKGRVVVERLVPVLSGRCWSLALLRFGQIVADAAATEWSLNNLKLDIPTSQAVVVRIPAQTTTQTIPLPDGTISGTLRIPNFDYDDQVKLRTIWLLRDGIHVLIAH